MRNAERNDENNMKIVLTLLVVMMAIGATLYSGLLHGRIRHEFGLRQELTEQVRLVESLPSEFGRTVDGGGERTTFRRSLRIARVC